MGRSSESSESSESFQSRGEWARGAPNPADENDASRDRTRKRDARTNAKRDWFVKHARRRKRRRFRNEPTNGGKRHESSTRPRRFRVSYAPWNAQSPFTASNVAISNVCATSRSSASPNGRPTICRPTGSVAPFYITVPALTTTAGQPARLTFTVMTSPLNISCARL